VLSFNTIVYRSSPFGGFETASGKSVFLVGSISRNSTPIFRARTSSPILNLFMREFSDRCLIEHCYSVTTLRKLRHRYFPNLSAVVCHMQISRGDVRRRGGECA
jgi:hypothetical protein